MFVCQVQRIINQLKVAASVSGGRRLFFDTQKANLNNDLIICVILNAKKDSLLMLNHKCEVDFGQAHRSASASESNKSTNNRRNDVTLNNPPSNGASDSIKAGYGYQYWFPYRHADQTQNTNQLIENFIKVIEHYLIILWLIFVRFSYPSTKSIKKKINAI